MGKKKNTLEGFIHKSKEIFGDKYDYSKVEYTNNHTKVCIICPEHGEFWKTPNLHLSQKQGCPICGSKKKQKSLSLSAEEVIERFKEAHGETYDYSKVEFTNTKTKVCVICPKHGEFWQTPEHHMKGRGCQKCQYEGFSKGRRDTLEEFLQKAKQVHGDVYDYSKVEYVNNHTKVCIICPEHGEFWQTPVIHLNGCGCPVCGRMKANESESLTTEIFIERSCAKHGYKYDYSKSVYVRGDKPVVITCPIHGDFQQCPRDHLNGSGCQECKKETLSKLRLLDTETFIERAKQRHGNRYDYSKTIYEKSNKKVTVICPIHGEFKVAPTHHISGVGCPLCRESKLEIKVNNILIKNNIQGIRQHTFKELGKLSLDFYLPDYNVAIECQGEQHYRPVKHFGGEVKFKKTMERDLRKQRICEEQGIKLLYFADEEFSDHAITDENKLIETILSNG